MMISPDLIPQKEQLTGDRLSLLLHLVCDGDVTADGTVSQVTSGCGQMSANAQIYIRNVNVKQRVYVKYKCITCSSLVLLTHTDSYVLYIKHV